MALLVSFNENEHVNKNVKSAPPPLRLFLVATHILLGALLASAYAGVDAADFIAPNVVVISPTLTTSGQPTAPALRALSKHGFEAVVFLVPAGVDSNVAGEDDMVKRQGIEFVHIPIKFGEPGPQHYAAFAGAMTRLTGKKVLVHCEINLRASSMVFLYRSIALKEDPSRAYESVAKVWSPRGPWKDFIQETLRKNAIKFELY